MPEIVADVPSPLWTLSDQGRRRCIPLAERLGSYQPSALATSPEPKALETARLVAARCGLEPFVVDGLHENDRSGIGSLPVTDVVQLVAEFFDRPEQLVMGMETAHQATARFSAAVAALVEAHSDGDLVVVAHGTVITLLVAEHNDIEPMPFWHELGLPSIAVLSLPGYGLLETVCDAG